MFLAKSKQRFQFIPVTDALGRDSGLSMNLLMRCQERHVYVPTYKHVDTRTFEHTHTQENVCVCLCAQACDGFKFPVKSVIIGQFRTSFGMLVEESSTAASQIGNQHANDKSGAF